MRKYITLKDIKKNVYGRTLYTESNALALSWSLSAFEIRFRAEKIVIHFEKYTDEKPAYVKLSLDGLNLKYCISSGKEKIILEDLTSDVHQIKLTKITENALALNVAGIELQGEEAEILDPPEPPKFRIEFIGDSITCGLGVLSRRGETEYKADEQDVTKSYAGQTAEVFGADARVTAMSGMGIVRDWAGNVNIPIPTFFEFKSKECREQHDFDSWKPHVVVINAGTNDSGGKVTFEEFYEGADKFIDRIREVYPDAYIFWVYGLMNLTYDKVLTELFENRRKTDPKIGGYVSVDTIGNGIDEIGANWHPNVKANTRAANALIDRIRAELGL